MDKLSELLREWHEICFIKFYFYVCLIEDIEEECEDSSEVRTILKEYFEGVIKPKAKEIEETYQKVLPQKTAQKRIEVLKKELKELEKDMD